MAAIWVSNRLAGHGAEQEQENLDILAAGMEDLHHIRLGQQRAQGGKVDALGLRVHDRDILGAGKLDEAEFRVIGALAHEFGIDRDECLGREALAKGGEFGGGGDEGGIWSVHDASLYRL